MKHLRTFESYSILEASEGKGADMAKPKKADVVAAIEKVAAAKLAKMDKEDLKEVLAALKKLQGTVNENRIFEGKEGAKKTFMDKFSAMLVKAGLSTALAGVIATAVASVPAVTASLTFAATPGAVPAALLVMAIGAATTVVGGALGGMK